MPGNRLAFELVAMGSAGYKRGRPVTASDNHDRKVEFGGGVAIKVEEPNYGPSDSRAIRVKAVQLRPNPVVCRHGFSSPAHQST